MIQVHSKTILSMEFNPILKAHGSSHGNYLSKPMVNLMEIISISLTFRLSFKTYITRNWELCKRIFLIYQGSCKHLLHHSSTKFHCYIGNHCWKMFSWRIKDHFCCPPQAKIKSISYLNTSSNSMTLFQTTDCCIFTSHNLPSCCKGLKGYCISKSLTLPESKFMKISTP